MELPSLKDLMDQLINPLNEYIGIIYQNICNSITIMMQANVLPTVF